ncbi:hypothetical protein NP493_523g01016 [Ridgeia piscesae]|uniref:Sulfide:quinone oxidoreductase, mitochondrial n=1 Tax=Ridgeia piscesae TaxID=27915 RepID=A0AAD9NSC3_RIDPI|nr:hypothetical protein NP493_523g01016 [Ridgeia piscesae]
MTLRTSIRGLRARRLLRLGWSQETSSEHPRRIHSTAMLTAAEDKAKAKTDTYKLLIVGGGSAGTAVASKFAQKLDKHFIGIIEPSQTHYYQPMFTLVGSGQRHISQTHRPTGSVLPDNCDWLQTSVSGFSPADNTVSTADGRLINYEYLVLALGMETNYQLVKGLPEALEHDPAVCSNYHPKYAQKTFPAMQAFKEGNAIFTYPNTLIKCGGAAQKILYMTEEYFRKTGKRDKATMIYNTSLGVVFPVPKYSKALYAQILQRNIQLNLMRNLVEVRHETKEAVFEVLGSDGVLETYWP